MKVVGRFLLTMLVAFGGFTMVMLVLRCMWKLGALIWSL